MSEALVKTESLQREIYLTIAQGDFHLLAYPPFTEEEKDGLPKPTHMGFINKHIVLGNGSQHLTITRFIPKEGRSQEDQLLEYAHEVAEHLGDCALDETLYSCNPDTVFEHLLRPVEVAALPQYL